MRTSSTAIVFLTAFFIAYTGTVSEASDPAEGGKSPVLVADLSSKEEVPPVESSARGRAEFYLSEDGRELRYQLKISGMSNITAAHIHLGSQGENDRVVVVLFDFTSPWESTIRSTDIEGVITESNLVGPLVGNSLSDLLREMGAGNTYINVHSKEHPQGHVRGHIVKPAEGGQ